MTTGPVAGVREFVIKAFPSRQIYHRSNGTVHFTELGPWTQLSMTLLTLLFLGWVAYASVNVVFKDQIIAAKDARFRSMQQAYEGRISKIQLSYDELNALLAMAEDRFRASTDELDRRLRQIEVLNVQRQALLDADEALAGRAQQMAGADWLLPQIPEKLMAQIESDLGQGTAQGGPEDSSAQAVATVDLPADESIAAATLISATPGGPEAFARNLPQGDPLVRFSHISHTSHSADTFIAIQADQSSVMDRISGLMLKTSQDTEAQIRRMEKIIRLTGLKPDDLAGPRREAAVIFGDASEGTGGPLFPLFEDREASAETTAEQAFEAYVLAIDAQLERLSSLHNAVATMPILLPVINAERLSSGFGPRLDPFTRRWAFHSGLDFAGEYGDAVIAPGDGEVVYADRKGPYGNMVEIDHGGGFRTRFGHLQSINVKVGDTVSYRQLIGKVGSTGRSTGPHLHYEVWYNNKARDPRNFLRAGRYVFQE